MVTIIGETYWELFHNRPHWLFELTVELVTFVFATLPIRWWVKRHDLDHPTKAEFKILTKRVAMLEALLQEKETA